jgi:hypothetical protein
LGIGTSFGPEIGKLFFAGIESAACHEIRMMFARLGQALTVQQALLESKDAHLKDIRQWEELEKHYSALAERASGLEGDLADERTRSQESAVLSRACEWTGA